MLAGLLARSPESTSSPSRGARLRLALAAFVCVAGFAVGFAYHYLTYVSGPSSGLASAGYALGILVTYGLLWVVLSTLHRRRQSTPAKTFWTALVLGLLFTLLARVALGLGNPLNVPSIRDGLGLGFDINTGAPLALATVVKMNLISLFEAVFAFALLLRLKDLVLFRRTKSSQRNWHLLLGVMALSSLSAFMKPPDEDLGAVQVVALIPAVALMVVNSFRLSWIVLLSFREKTLCIALSLGLLVLLATGVGVGETTLLPGAATFLKYYSYPLGFFTQQALIFGVLYSLTTFLSLLFHLPTTSDFQQKAGEIAAMHSLTGLVSQVFNFDQLGRTITASPVENGSAQGSWLALPDPQTGSLRPRIAYTCRIPPAAIEQAVDTAALYNDASQKRQPILLNQAPADHRIATRPGDGIGSLLVLPLIAREQVLGALFLTREVTFGFEQDDVEAATIFGAQAALALDHAHLFEEQVEKERLARELDIAREVQRKLLPQRLPQLRGVSFAASSVPAQEVGGDFYDFAELDEHRVAFIIADVSGKGTSAAFYMAEMQGIFQSVSRLASSPVDFLTHANNALARSLEKHVFITVTYGVLDTRNETVTIARAGHCPAAFSSLSGEARFVRSRGLGLGLDRGSGYRQAIAEEHHRLQPGDVIVLYTDGVVESRNEAGDEYGYDRLLGALCEHRHEDASDLHASLVGHLNGFLGEKAYDDDMSMVVIKWHGISLPDRLVRPEGKSHGELSQPNLSSQVQLIP